jgi:chorismate lyase / 3-hydroxybenzoate synthase
MPVIVAAPGVFSFAVEFGAPATALISSGKFLGLALSSPVLGGQVQEAIFPARGTASDSPGGLHLLDAGDLCIGWATEPVTDSRLLSTRTLALYRRMLSASRGRHLYRVWNYVPQINVLTENFENYRAFCQGRSLGFEETLGAAFPGILPAASAVGSEDGFLSLVFVCGTAVPRHIENPEQIPAYRYPAEHGPRAPSFSRATVVQTAGKLFTFISGTAAIKGHTTVAPDALPDQLDCTVDNLRIISREAGAGDDLGAAKANERYFKVYLRHAGDFDIARTHLERSLLGPTDKVTYLRSDICRAALRVEIEATLVS